MNKLQLTPDTTLFPVPVVLVTCGTGQAANVFSLNRIASCNAEPPMISISVRPSRASHDLIDRFGEFVVNIPGPNMDTFAYRTKKVYSKTRIATGSKTSVLGYLRFCTDKFGGSKSLRQYAKILMRHKLEHKICVSQELPCETRPKTA